MAPPERPAPMLPGLLARKGEARPAMRNNGLAAALVQDDDFGWNDFGGEGTRVPAVPPVDTGSDASGATLHVALDAVRLARLHAVAAARGCTIDALLADLIDRLIAGDPDPSRVEP
ncbi:hypothetical protein [Sphingomonas sp. VNH70]|uniref:hypothetical protein n=1 Tax=Sphingomonas silueang TaxID=3156617 RepID=UPI0032B43DE2